MKQGRDARYSRNKRRVAAYYSGRATYLLLTTPKRSSLMNIATHESNVPHEREARARGRKGNETQRRNIETRGGRGGSAILVNRIYPENPTIDTAEIRLCSTWNNRRKRPSEFMNATARGL